jgi:hypothetical protein
MKLTLMMLANNHHQHHDECQVSQARLAQETEQSERTVRSQLKKLEQDGIIKRVRTFDERGGRGEDEYILIGLTSLSEDEIRLRADARRRKPYRKDLPVGPDKPCVKTDENPTGNMLPLGGEDQEALPAKSARPTGKIGTSYRQTVAGTYKEDRTLRIDRKDLDVGDTRAREPCGVADEIASALNALRREIGEPTWRSWIAELRIVSHDPPALSAASRFKAQYVRQTFGPRLEALLDKKITIEFQKAHAVRGGS